MQRETGRRHDLLQAPPTLQGLQLTWRWVDAA